MTNFISNERATNFEQNGTLGYVAMFQREMIGFDQAIELINSAGYAPVLVASELDKLLKAFNRSIKSIF